MVFFGGLFYFFVFFGQLLPAAYCKDNFFSFFPLLVLFFPQNKTVNALICNRQHNRCK